MTKSLNDVEWKEFNLISKKTFYLEKPLTLKSTSYTNNKAKHDVVGATSKNNGNVGFFDDNSLLLAGNCICLIKTGEGSVGEAVYKSNKFIPSNNVNVIRMKNLNKYIGLFITTEINNNSNRYSYGYIRNEKRILKEKIMLPIDGNFNPDWQFMEEYIKEKEQNLKEKYKKHVQSRIKELEKFINEKREWRNLKLADLFIMQKGNQNNMATISNGKLPLVSAKKIDNGYKSFVTQNKKTIFSGHIITLNNDGDGGCGLAYYQPHKMLLDSHVTALIPRLDISRFSLLYIARCISKQRDSFGHGYSINNTRLKIFTIILPINSKAEPDYEYMENYMKYLEQKKILKYLDFIKVRE